MQSKDWTYCPDLLNYQRWQTREVQIGNVPMGGNNPIRIQSMTTTDTMDTEGTVAQCIRMVESGCEYIRITAPSLKEAENLRVIKASLREKGYDVPLVADIHYTPNAAELAAKIVEKVRVNPGNYVDKKKFNIIEYTDAQYQEELERIRVRFTPLVEICKEHGTAMRIGTNHGSLSDRIMSRYGDSPLGMVESAMEFLRICESLNYHNIVLSMKASNPQVMVQAYRLLVNNMMNEGMNYPLHLGVTEAGDGEDGRIKSAVGIGTLLEDGLGDTIRVSLTEDPEHEAPIAKLLADRYVNRSAVSKITTTQNVQINPFEYHKRISKHVLNIGTGEVPRIICDLSSLAKIQAANLFALGYQYSVPTDKWNITDTAVDYLFVGDNELCFQIPGTLGIVQNHKKWLENADKKQHYPLIHIKDLSTSINLSPALNFIQADPLNIDKQALTQLDALENVVLVLSTDHGHGVSQFRRVFNLLLEIGIETPVIIHRAYEGLSFEEFQLYAPTDFGALILDGQSDGIFLTADLPLKKVVATAFGVLQATRTRISKTEYISCPSCGRTLFELQETTAKIRKRTDHLKGLKIGIMGCIVNGPGEMADADYGYVGSGVGKITLYKGQTVVKKGIPSEQAVDELIDIIKDGGDWVEV
jgi:(E)-4-hydroxy-3-methylbut-2-enyl-diphosphate synthase